MDEYSEEEVGADYVEPISNDNPEHDEVKMSMRFKTKTEAIRWLDNLAGKV